MTESTVDLASGSVLATSDFAVTRTAIVRYQGAAGDFNPVHHDDEAAQRSGNHGAFTVGMLPAAMLGTLVQEAFANTELRSIRTRFLTQTWPGDTPTLAVRFAEARSVGGRLRISVEVSCVRQDRSPAIAGSAELDAATEVELLLVGTVD